jgi:hypothetical protein
VEVFDQTAPMPLNPDGCVNAHSLRDDADWFAAHGCVASPPDVASLIDSQFVYYAISHLGLDTR